MQWFFQYFTPGVFFGLGLMFQSIFRVFPQLFSKDEKKKFLAILPASFLISLGFYFKVNIGSHNISQFLLIFFSVYTVFVSAVFREYVLSEIHEITLLVWNCGLLYLTIAKFGLVHPFTLIAFTICLLAFGVALFRVPLTVRLEAAFYAWFMVIGVVVSAFLIPWSALFGHTTHSLSHLDMFFLGTTLFYTISYILYLGYFIPFLSKGKTFRKSFAHAKGEVRQHAHLLSIKYNETQFHPTTALIIILFVASILYSNSIFHVVSDITLLAFLFGVSPFIGEKYNSYVTLHSRK